MDPKREETGRQTAWFYGEPSVEDLLSDPIVDLLMRHDRITAEDVWAAVQVARSRLRAAGERDPRAA